MWHAMAITALFSSLQLASAFIYLATVFRAPISGWKLGILRWIRQMVVPFFWIAKTSSVCLKHLWWETTVLTVILSPLVKLAWSKLLALCQPVSTLVKHEEQFCLIYIRELTWNSNKQLMKMQPANFKLQALLGVLWSLSFTNTVVMSLGDLACYKFEDNMKLTKCSHSNGFIIKTPSSIPARLSPHWIHLMCKIFQPDFTGYNEKRRKLGITCFPFLTNIAFCLFKALST